MKAILPAAFVLMLLSGGHPAQAEDLGLSKEFSRCMDRSGGVTVEMVNCIVVETKAQDARLNKAYKRLMGQLSPERKRSLQEAQRLWIRYRDANCDFYADPEGGTLARVNTVDCILSETSRRAKELEALSQ